MYEQNFLANELRQASIGNEDANFLQNFDTGLTRSYGEFFANAERIASVLIKAGLKPGDRVAVQAPKTEIMLELYVATVIAGGVFLPLNTAYTAGELEYFLGDAKPKILVIDPAKREVLEKLAAASGVSEIFTIAGDGTGSLSELRDAETPGIKAVPRGPDEIAAILYTSGTTGRSKGAMLTHGALASNARTLADVWRFEREDILIHALPIFHTHGLFVATNVTLIAGSACIFMAEFNTSSILQSLPNASVLMGVPTFYTRLLETEGLREASANMRLFISGSAPLLADTHKLWREVTGHAILERYGMTETNMNTSNPYDGERRAGTVGFALPGVEVVVKDPESGRKLKSGEIGMLEVRGPNVFAGYWNMPEKTAEELRSDGFFVTGDLGLIDEDGYIHIVGRGKDLIITGGYNVYPKEIEVVIDGLAGIQESAVFGVPHPDFGEGVVAVVVQENGHQLSEEYILDKIKNNLARFKQPKHIFIVEELPRNTMGKIQKNKLCEAYESLFDAH